MFGGAGGAEFSVSLPACRTLVVVAQGGHVILSNVEADVIVVNPDGKLRLTAQHLKGNLHVFGTTPDDIADVRGDVYLCNPYRMGKGGMWNDGTVERPDKEYPRVTLRNVRGNLTARVGNVTAHLENVKGGAPLRFQTVTGAVNLSLSPSLAARLGMTLKTEGGIVD